MNVLLDDLSVNHYFTTQVAKNIVMQNPLPMQHIAQVLASITDPQEMSDFLTEILTPSERENLVLRWQLLRLLDDGLPQRAIAQQLGVSLCKITRGAKILKQADSLTQKFLKKGHIDEI